MMETNTLKEFMGGVDQPVAIATTNNGQPALRYFSFKMYENGRIYFMTGKKKAIYKQLCENPFVEICTIPNAKAEWLRLKARTVFEKNAALNKKAFELLPLLKQAFGSPDSEEIALFYLADVVAEKYTATNWDGKLGLK